MKKMSLLISLLTLISSVSSMASSNKICLGSTKSYETKGAIMLAQIDEKNVTLKAIVTVGGYDYTGTFPNINSPVKGRDGKVYLAYKGITHDQQDIILVDSTLLIDSTTGLLQIRSRGEGFYNAVYFCKDAK